MRHFGKVDRAGGVSDGRAGPGGALALFTFPEKNLEKPEAEGIARTAANLFVRLNKGVLGGVGGGVSIVEDKVGDAVGEVLIRANEVVKTCDIAALGAGDIFGFVCESTVGKFHGCGGVGQRDGVHCE